MTYIEGLRTGAWRLVPVEATPAQTNAAWNKGKRLRMTGCTEDFRSVVEAANAASPDASSALLAEIEGLRGAAVGAAAALAAAISLLERAPKAAKAAPSDRMFDQMLSDYRTALETARVAITKGPNND